MCILVFDDAWSDFNRILANAFDETEKELNIHNKQFNLSIYFAFLFLNISIAIFTSFLNIFHI